MNEQRALLPFRGRKLCSIPRTLQHWLYFKRHLLEKTHVREHLQRSPHLEKASFREFLFSCEDALPDVFGPRFCRLKNRASKERNQRELVCVCYRYYEVLLSPLSPIEVRPSNIENGGLGLFLRKSGEEEHSTKSTSSSSSSSSTSYSHDDLVLSSVLWGIALELNSDDYETLVDSNYPSLLCGYRGKRFIIAGPLSVANHACRSPLCFTSPRQVIDPELPEEFANIPAIRLLARRDVSLEAGKEIFVDYFCTYSRLKRTSRGVNSPTVFGETCRCPTCNKKLWFE